MLLESLGGLPVGSSLSFQVSRRGRPDELTLDGRIQWCRLVTTQVAAGGDVVPRYQAGISFPRAGSPVTQERWSELQIIDGRETPVTEVAERRAAAAESEPPLLLIHRPEDGARVHTFKVRVTGRVLEPLAGLSVLVNGVAARVNDHRFEVEVHLDEGANTLTAAAVAGDEFVYRSPAVTIVYEPTRSGTLLADAARRREETAKLFN